MQHPDNGREERRRTIASWPEALRADFEERAAIIEYLGGMERPWAELRAFVLVDDAETQRRSLESLSSPGWQERRRT